MNSRRKLVARAAALLSCAYFLSSGLTASAAEGNKCDRECLKGLTDGYLAALVARDPSRLSVTPDLKFTENTNRLKLGDGLWQTVDQLGTYKLYVEDPENHQAAFYGTVKENGKTALLGVRLKENARRITELETMVVRQASGIHGTFDALEKPDPVWEQPIPAGERVSRQQLIHAADQYFTGIVESTGDIVPFSDNCLRIENGRQTAPKPASASGPAMSCQQLFNTKMYNYIHEVTDRRFLVIDQERGLVVAFAMFQHPGNIKTPVRLDTGGQPQQFPLASYPNTTQIMEVFQLRSGKIHNIFAYIALQPYRQNPGW